MYTKMQFFPLELTVKDYAHRILDMVAAGIRGRIETALLNATASTTSSKPFSQDSLKLVLPDPSSYALLRTVFSSVFEGQMRGSGSSGKSNDGGGNNQHENDTLADFVFPQKGIAEKFTYTVKTLLSMFASIAFPETVTETGQLYAMNDIFDAANDVLKHFPVDPPILMAQKELHELHQQVYSHMLYNNNRMSINSWTYDGEAFDSSTGMGGLHHTQAQSSLNHDEIDAGVSDGLIAHAQDVCMQMQGLLEPQNVSRACLIRRIVQSAEDTRVFASTACDHLDYDEGLRLREIAIKMDRLISDQDR